MESGELFKKTQRVAHVSKFQEHEGAITEKQKNKKLRASLKSLKSSAATHDTDTEDDDLVEFVKSVKSKKRQAFIQSQSQQDGSSKINNVGDSVSSVRVIASGVVTNNDVLPLSHLNSEDPTSLKLKLKLADVGFYNLRAATKPDQLNENALLLRQVRRSYLQREILFPKRKAPSSTERKPAAASNEDDIQIVAQHFSNKLEELNGAVKKETSGRGRPKKTKPKPKRIDPVIAEKIKQPLSKSAGAMAAPKKMVEFHEAVFNLNSVKFSEENPAPVVLLRNSGRDMDWDQFLSKPENLKNIPPVSFFKQAPFFDIWDKIAIPGMFIELRNPFVKNRGDVFWIGRVVHFAGYKGLVKFETFENAPTKNSSNYMVWIGFCTSVPRPLGWCAKNGKELSPGPIVKMSATKLQQKMADFYSQAHPTVADDHESMLLRQFEIVEKTWKPSGKYEALDLINLHQNRLVRVSAIVGNRVNVQYYQDQKGEYEDQLEEGFWYHWKSDRLHKFMWSYTVGVHLNGIDPAIRGLVLPPETFPSWPEDKIKIELGMRLEARHPFRTNKIVGAVIIKVLKYGHFIVQTRDVEMLRRVSFVFHVTSPFIFPVGFGKSHNIKVEFAVDDFGERLNTIVSETAPCLRLDLLPPRTPHRFSVGHKLEAIEVTTSTYIGPATVAKIAGHMLYLYFDGWRSDLQDNYQWVDAEASEIYPAGYCELMGLDWQGTVGRK